MTPGQIRLVPACLLLSLGWIGCVTRPSSSLGSAHSIDELESENAELREQLEILRGRMQVLASDTHSGFVGTRCPIYPAIDASLLEVREEQRSVVLDKGAADGVEPGFVFDVYRGTQYKGRVRIMEVWETTSAGQILSEKNAMADGDSATTRL